MIFLPQLPAHPRRRRRHRRRGGARAVNPSRLQAHQPRSPSSSPTLPAVGIFLLHLVVLLLLAKSGRPGGGLGSGGGSGGGGIIFFGTGRGEKAR